MLFKINASANKSVNVLFLEIGFCDASVILERANSCNKDYCIRLQSRKTAFDVKETICVIITTIAM